MSLRAEGSCETRNWSEEPYFALNDEKLSLAKVLTSFSGDIAGEGAAGYLMVYTGQNAGTFVGVERIVGSVGGRTGSFVGKIQGTFATDALEADWSVVPGSGRGGLAEIQGAGTYSWKKEQGHRTLFTFEYDLE